MNIFEPASLEQLREKRYAEVLCYPRYDAKELEKRISELKTLSVRTLEFTGEKKAFNLPVLGKGCVGIVVAAHAKTGKVALKIRRIDADRAGMQREAEMLRKANSIDVGPVLLGVSDNFLLMHFVEGMLLPKWVEKLKGRGVKARIRHVLRDVLEQCWRLDDAGLDHGELSRAPKHVIVDSEDKPTIVDFETASLSRRASNVTSICQYLFIGSQVARTIQKRYLKIDKEKLVRALGIYKRNRSRENLNKILKIAGLSETTCQVHNPRARFRCFLSRNLTGTIHFNTIA